MKTASGRGPLDAFDDFARSQREARRVILTSASLILVENWKEMLSRPGTGRIRRSQTDRKGKGSFVHTSFAETGKTRRMVRRGIPRTDISRADRASAPGEPPAPDTANLRNSIQYEPSDTEPFRVGTNAEYADDQEFGTATILPRPHGRPAKIMSERQMSETVIATLKRSSKNLGNPTGTASRMRGKK